MDTKNTFLDACNKINNSLSEFGFKPLQKGQRLKKTSVDKDIIFEIYFQSSFRNTILNIQIIPQINIYSKQLKKWSANQTHNIHESGFIFGTSLENIIPPKQRHDWDVSRKNQKETKAEIAQLIVTYTLPIFTLFENKEKAIQFLETQGTQFNRYTKKSLHPLDFMLYFAKKSEAEQFFNNFILSCGYKDTDIELYKKLSTAKVIDLNYSEFYYANKIKLAFVHNLKIKKLATTDTP